MHFLSFPMGAMKISLVSQQDCNNESVKKKKKIDDISQLRRLTVVLDD